MYVFQKFKFEMGDTNYCASTEGNFTLGFSFFALSHNCITVLVYTVLYA